MTDRVITQKQPHPDFIMKGEQDMLNLSYPVPSTLPRRWTSPYEDEPGDTRFPFRLWIHAAVTFADGWRRVTVGDYLPLGRLEHPVHGPAEWVPQWRLGVLLGHVTVTGCHHADECRVSRNYGSEWGFCSRWAEPDAYHWELSDPVPLDEPIPMRGRPGLWTLSQGVLDD